MSKKVIKLAVIRTNEETPCPFGLSIPFGCKSAGKYIDKMASLDSLDDDDKERIAKANNRLLAWVLDSPEEISPCRYASQISEERKAVECNYKDTAPGVGPETALVSATYSRNFDQPGMVGLLSYPLNYYDDFGGIQNGYYGLYSLQGEVGITTLIKLAERAIDRNEDD